MNTAAPDRRLPADARAHVQLRLRSLPARRPAPAERRGAAPGGRADPRRLLAQALRPRRDALARARSVRSRICGLEHRVPPHRRRWRLARARSRTSPRRSTVSTACTLRWTSRAWTWSVTPPAGTSRCGRPGARGCLRAPPGRSPGARACRSRRVVSLAGVCDLAGAYRDWHGGAVRALMGGSPERLPDRYAVADPLRRVPLAMPALLVHGVLDETVSVG